MKSDQSQTKTLVCLITAFLAVTFYFLHTNNPESDSWYYAACVKYKQEIFNSHHLLYNSWGLLFLNTFNAIGFNLSPLQALFMMNAISGALCYFFMYLILRLQQIDAKNAVLLPLLAVCSFGFFRFATDAETYVLPILFSLISTFYYLRNRSNSDIVKSGFFSALAILTHQIQIWWTLALLINLFINKTEKRSKTAVLFTLPLMLIPLTYLLVYQFHFSKYQSFSHFILGEYARGNAGLQFDAFKLTAINFIRSFFQIHGRIIDLFSHHKWFIMVPVSIVFILAIGLNQKKQGVRTSSPDIWNSRWAKIAILLHLLFAFLSSGNAEFMAMIPVLVVLAFADLLSLIQTSYKTTLLICLLIWNIGLGILPLSVFDIRNPDKLVRIARDPTNFCILREKVLIENILTYEDGFRKRENLADLRAADSTLIIEKLKLGLNVYTDLPNHPDQYSRAGMMNPKRPGTSETIALSDTFRNLVIQLTAEEKAILGESLKLKMVDSFETLKGENHIFKIERKQ